MCVSYYYLCLMKVKHPSDFAFDVFSLIEIFAALFFTDKSFHIIVNVCCIIFSICVYIGMPIVQFSVLCIPQQVCSTHLCRSHSWFRLCLADNRYKLHLPDEHRECLNLKRVQLQFDCRNSRWLCCDSYILKDRRERETHVFETLWTEVTFSVYRDFYVSYFHRCFPWIWFLVAMAAGGNQGNTGYSFLHRCCVHTHTAASVQTYTRAHSLTSMDKSQLSGHCAGEQVTGDCYYLGNRVQWAALSMSIADAHSTHRDVFDGVIILREKQLNSC